MVPDEDLGGAMGLRVGNQVVHRAQTDSAGRSLGSRFGSLFDRIGSNRRGNDRAVRTHISPGGTVHLCGRVHGIDGDATDSTSVRDRQ